MRPCSSLLPGLLCVLSSACAPDGGEAPVTSASATTDDATATSTDPLTTTVDPGDDTSSSSATASTTDPTTTDSATTDPTTTDSTTTDSTTGDDEPGLALFGDADRDGALTPADLALAATLWSWEGPGALVLANLDDDDGDGKRDADDGLVNGAEDAADLARLRVVGNALPPDAAVTLAFTGGHAETCAAVLRVHVGGEGWSALAGPVQLTDGALELGLEATRFAGPDWPGLCTLTASAAGLTASTELRVAPWLVLSNAAETGRLYVATGAYANQGFLDGLAAVATELAGLGGAIEVIKHPTALWRDMWMQDTMEIGYTEIPGPGGAQRMHVALRANRGPDADKFPPTLLAPGVGVLEVGDFRDLGGGDEWADWYGNLEVSPPVPGYPLGRVYYGHNSVSGIGLHPAVVDFIAAQELQEPFAVDTSWLSIKHVDEIFNFLPGPDQKPRMIVASPRAAVSFRPLDAYNSDLQTRLDATVAAAIVALNLEPAQVIELPVAFRAGDLGALNIWSNPVNSVYLNGLLITGDTDETNPNKLIPLAPALKGLMNTAVAGAAVTDLRFLDDAPYQIRWGNVHCATNTLRIPLVDGFWTAL